MGDAQSTAVLLWYSGIHLPERESWALQGASVSSESRGDVELKFHMTRANIRVIISGIIFI